jgi:MATE family multidrug resistance protein
VWLLGYPLMLSQLSFMLQSFVDRIFLAWHSAEAVAAAATAVITIWGLVGLFIGTGEYLTAFVAQYLGAGRPRRIGAVMWQGIWFALVAGLLMLGLSPGVGAIFEWAGHTATLREYETTYGRVMMMGAFPTVLMATLSTFFAGLGRTRVVLLVNVVVTCVNAGLDWAWIFGNFGFPAWGVAGAAWATVCSQAVGALCYLALMLRARERREYATLSSFRFEPALFGRLLRFGLPTGLQFSLEVVSFGVFLMILGRLGTVPLAATSLAFNLNGLVFMPTLGMAMGISALVARYLGAEQPQHAERAVASGLWLCSGYLVLWAGLYLGVPHLLLAPYAAGAREASSLAPVTAQAAVLLRYVAFYSFFDMVNVITAGGLKGAGDTRYPLWVTIALAWVVLLPPTLWACAWLAPGPALHVSWCAATAYVLGIGVMMRRRFRAGAWKTLRVIEAHAPLPGAEAPA